jgi:uncharacterized protein (TIGR02996 family)
MSTGPATLDALLQAVYAAPDADEPRLVYADALQEIGDPRGEFIALQFKRARGETLSRAEWLREVELAQRYGAAWIGPLAQCTFPARRWDRGFLVEATLSPSGPKPQESVDAAVGAGAWSTVRRLGVVDPNLGADVRALLGHAALAGLRTLGAVDLTTAASIARGAPRALEAMQVVMSWAPRLSARVVEEDLAALCDAPALPRLRRLTIRRWDDRPATAATARGISWLLARPIVARLEELAVQETTIDVDGWLAALAVDAPRRLQRVELLAADYSAGAVLVRDGARWRRK